MERAGHGCLIELHRNAMGSNGLKSNVPALLYYLENVMVLHNVDLLSL